MFRAAPLLAFASFVSVSGCERVIDVGGAVVSGFDGGSDASIDGASEPFRPDAVYGPSATPAQVQEFARQLSGRWYGIVIPQTAQEGYEVEFDFIPDHEASTQGAFYFVCGNGDHCEPFGFAAVESGRYALKHLGATPRDGGGEPVVGAALGLLSWEEHGDDLQIPFRDMLLQRGGGVLSFRFTTSSAIPDERTAILVRTKPVPTDDGGVSDGGGL